MESSGGAVTVRRLATQGACLLISIATGGCITGSLATDTGTSTGGWSVDKQQLAHVGETVAFSFVLVKGSGGEAPLDPFGVADYCIGEVGGRPCEAQLTDDGHFVFSATLADAKSGQTITARATAYRTRSLRDSRFIDGQQVHGESPYDPADLEIAHDSVTLIVYESLVELAFERPSVDLNLALGTLTIGGPGGAKTTVEASQNGSDGFTYSGPDEKGVYRVTYRPSADQLNKTGTTPIRLAAPDREGGSHVIDAVIATP